MSSFHHYLSHESLEQLRSDFVELSKGKKRPQSLVRITKEVQRFNLCAHETGFSKIFYYASDVKKHPLKLVITWKNENILYTISFYMPYAYPFLPPKVKIDRSPEMTQWHPNIVNGHLQIDLLTQASWSPALNIDNLMSCIKNILLEPDYKHNCSGATYLYRLLTISQRNRCNKILPIVRPHLKSCDSVATIICCFEATMYDDRPKNRKRKLSWKELRESKRRKKWNKEDLSDLIDLTLSSDSEFEQEN